MQQKHKPFPILVDVLADSQRKHSEISIPARACALGSRVKVILIVTPTCPASESALANATANPKCDTDTIINTSNLLSSVQLRLRAVQEEARLLDQSNDNDKQLECTPRQ